MYYYLLITIIVLSTIWILLLNYYLGKGKGYFKNGDYQKSLEYYRKILKFAPSNSEAILNIGIIKLKEGNYWYAISMFEKYLKVDKINALNETPYYYIGYCNERMGSHYSAFINYVKYVEVKNNFSYFLRAKMGYDMDFSCEKLSKEKLKTMISLLKESMEENERVIDMPKMMTPENSAI